MLEPEFLEEAVKAFHEYVHVAAKIPAVPGWRVVIVEPSGQELPEEDPDREFKKSMMVSIVEIEEWAIPGTPVLPEDPEEELKNPTMFRGMPSGDRMKAMRASLPSLLPIDPRKEGDVLIPLEQIGGVYPPSKESDEDIRSRCLLTLKRATDAYLEKIRQNNVRE